MKIPKKTKIINLIALGSLYPTFLVVSCGVNHKNQTVTKPKFDWSNSVQLVSKTDKNGLSPQELDYIKDRENSMYGYLGNPAKWSSMEFSVYTFKIPSTKTIDVFVDKAITVSDVHIKQLMENHFANVDWGVGVLSLDRIIITNAALKDNASGYGGQPANILIHSDKYLDNPDDLAYVSSIIKHEFEHHETMAMHLSKTAAKLIWDQDNPGSEVWAKVRDLKESGVINQQQFDDWVSNKEKVLKSDYSYNDLYNEFAEGELKGKTDLQQKPDLTYTFNNEEYLNRVMNMIEDVPWDGYKDYILDSYIFQNDFLEYHRLGEDVFNADGSLSEKGKLTIENYKKYVYCYDEDHIVINPWEIKGYTSNDFDFVKINVQKTGQPDKLDIFKVDKVMHPHFIEDTSFYGEKTILDLNKQGFFKEMDVESDWYGIKKENISFYIDSDKDGKLTDKDKKVDIDFSLEDNVI